MSVALGLAAVAHAAPQYAVQNLQTGEVVRRGVQTEAGIVRGEVILAPETLFRVWAYDPASKLIGFRDLFTPEAGETFTLDEIRMRPGSTPDTDGDGLSDQAEFVLGSNRLQADSDGDGVSDGAALALGINPVTGTITGLVGGVTTPGTARHVATRNDLAVVAAGAAGIAVFNIFNTMPPVRMAAVDTPGEARAVAISGNYVAVADGPSGLALIDISDPPAAAVTRIVPFGAETIAVAASAEVAYVALATGEVAAVSMASGLVLQRRFVAAGLQDLEIGGDVLYALTTTSLHALPLSGVLFSTGTTAPAPGPVVTRRRLHVGSQRAYAAHRDGYIVYSLADPAVPVLLNDVRPGTTPWRQIVSNGSGLGVAAHATQIPINLDTHLYTLTPDGLGDAFVTSFEQGARRVEALSLYNGLAYLASGGLEVLNYLAVDPGGVPPAITLQTSAAAGATEEGQPFRVTALVTDDVQVRNVEFYVDGARRVTDGNAPFEFRFPAPRATGGDSSFVVRARASDTGGNATWSDEVRITLTADRTPPLVVQSVPGIGTIAGSTDRFNLLFNEPLEASSFAGSVVRLFSAGPDELPGTPDDSEILPASLSLSPDGLLGTVTFASALPAGVYFFEIASGLRDLAGNVAPSGRLPTFRLVDGPDQDGDGLPDDVEPLLGLDPLNADSDADGVPDGLEDNDGEGLGNAIELVLGLDPLLPDSDGNGILDRDEDPDLDFLTILAEVNLGLNPLRDDTDGDGWQDEIEVTLGSGAANPNSTPVLYAAVRPTPRVVRPSTALPSGVEIGTVLATPSTSVIRPSTELPPGVEIGTVIAKPPTSVTRPTTP